MRYGSAHLCESATLINLHLYTDTHELDADILADVGARLPRQSTIEDFAMSLSKDARADLINGLQKAR